MDDLFEYVKEDKEVELYRFGNTEKKLSRHALRQFLVPGTAAGLFLCVAGAVFMEYSNNSLTLALSQAANALGGVIFASSLLLYAMFLRQARAARGCYLHITNKNIIWCERGRYAKIPLSEVSDVRSERGERFARLPFDLSELEGERIVLSWRGSDMKIPYIENASGASDKIKSLLG